MSSHEGEEVETPSDSISASPQGQRAWTWEAAASLCVGTVTVLLPQCGLRSSLCRHTQFSLFVAVTSSKVDTIAELGTAEPRLLGRLQGEVPASL